jgi:hypothetical protein
MTRARGAKFTAEIVHDGKHFLATLTWQAGHGGPQEVAGDSEETVEFRLRQLDFSVKFYADDSSPRRQRVTR